MIHVTGELIQGATIAAAVLSGLSLVVVWRVSVRLARIERRLAGLQEETHQAAHPGESLEERKAANREQKDLFRKFLAEDPERAKLPKKEQFEAYRRWRQDQGLNWQRGA